MGPALQAPASLVDMDLDNIVLYPNPANDKLYFENTTEEKSITFFDLNGRIIKKLKTNEQNIDVSNFKTGLYFVEINGQTKKFIKR